VEGAAEVWTAEVGAAGVGAGVDGTVEKERMEMTGAEGVGEGLGVEFGVDGVAGEGVVELEVEVVGGGDGRSRAAKREASGGEGRFGEGCGHVAAGKDTGSAHCESISQGLKPFSFVEL
jgi:hypothetical protein